METLYRCYDIRVSVEVSEELSSVETDVNSMYLSIMRDVEFQKNLVVWKQPYVVMLQSHWIEFQKNLVVWKRKM